MSKEFAEKIGLKIGQKVLYPHYIPYAVSMEIVTIKDVFENYDDEIVILTEEHEGCLNYGDICTQDQINRMFDT